MNMNRLPAVAAKLMFGLIVLGTVAAFFLCPVEDWGTGHWWISLISIVLAEAACYYCAVGEVKQNRRGDVLPASLTFVTISVLYGAAAIFHTVFFWLTLRISLTSYVLIEVITAVLWAIGMGLAYHFTNVVRNQEDDRKAQMQLMKQMKLALDSVSYALEEEEIEEREALKAGVRELIEKVKYSDPVSHPSMIHMEENLLWQIKELERCVRGLSDQAGKTGKVEMSRKLLRDISADLGRRNSQLITLK
ncbi:hypothetical protein [Paenibacillus ehimensis]|uniref:Uncharacterized protein n=1 Tax=Paenibacillus ehimensis TaxID=79264 RepID=A0ABT8V7D9_9BACL|nr:hypothetical protein [Paenibacillus ehimensis]MDO3677353.1 hypothetical protein [Paenibacillus ehimensis]MEC0208017.1 hypothetical protein [Paenibacillus ehimensis]